LYLELGDTYLRLAQPRQAVEAFEYGLRIQPASELFDDLSAAYLAMRDPQQAAITLIEGLLVYPGYTRLGSELLNLYRQDDPQSCAIRNAAGEISPNLACPMVHEQFCAASRNVARLYAEMGQASLATSAKTRAISEFGCAAQTLQ
jgi:tetratricopeptide (TPR) repeat protein